jgi:hypothetical protein
MKKILLLLLLFIAQHSFSQSGDIDKWRKIYIQGPKDSLTCAKMYQLITKENSRNNTILCYRGAITAEMAAYPANKAEKIKLFNAGKGLIEQSLAKDSSNVELHFIRFTIQTSCPKALGYNRQTDADKKKILNGYKSLGSAQLKQLISYFMLRSSYLSENEKAIFHD